MYKGGSLQSWRQYLAVFICALGVSSAGMALSWMEPLMQRMSSELDISPSESSWLLSSIELGYIAFTIPSGVLADRFGRKNVLLSSGPIRLVAWAMIFLNQSFYVLLIARVLHGVANAITFGVSPLYIAEVAAANVRGFLAGQFQTMWSLGLLVIYFTGPNMAFQAYIASCAFIPFIFTVFFCIMPETPYYLMMAKKDEEARKSLSWLRGRQSIEVELSSIKLSVDTDMKFKSSWKDLFSTKADRKIFLTAQLLCVIKYMSGAHAMSTNAADTFSRASKGQFNENTATILFGVLLLGSALVGSFMSDAIGRRPLLICTCLLISICYLITGIYFYMHEVLHLMDSGANLAWVVYSMISLSAILSNIGPSSLLQTVLGELFPSNTRAMGCALTGITSSVATFLDLKQYQTVIDIFGEYMNFFIFSSFALFGVVVMYVLMKETAGKSLGEIQTDMKRNEVQTCSRM